MGKKGFSRKAFLKPTKDTEEDDTGKESTHASTSAPASQEPAPKVDPANKFLKDSTPEPCAAGEQSSSPGAEPGSTPAVNEGTNGHVVEGETKGQLVQRHKKEWKLHKETAKKMGKKRKDEIEALEKALEERHQAELEAWEAANPDEEADKDTSVVAPTTGLYDLKINSTDDKADKKPTKAQKRREQKAAQEAERESRIAEEQANMGPSEKAVEAEELQALLGPLGLALVDIPADGHCMYRAIEHQLKSHDDESQKDMEELREETASYIRAFPDNFYPFIVQDESDKDQDEQLEEYCTKIEDTAAWGGQIELQALAQALERHIVVHAVGLPAVELGTEYKGQHKSLQVCYLRHEFGLGEHYNSVVQR